MEVISILDKSHFGIGTGESGYRQFKRQLGEN